MWKIKLDITQLHTYTVVGLRPTLNIPTVAYRIVAFTKDDRTFGKLVRQ